MPEWCEIVLTFTLGGLLISPILVPVIYFSFICEPLRKYREKKCRTLYPEFYVLMKKRDSIYNNERHKAYKEETNAQKSIDSILKEMPYTPLEDQSAKRMEIEVLKKKRLKAILERKKWIAEIDELQNQMDKMIDKSILLTKLYRNNW